MNIYNFRKEFQLHCPFSVEAGVKSSMDSGGDRDPFQDDDEDDDIRETQNAPVSQHIFQDSKQETQEHPPCNIELSTVGNFSQQTTPARSVLLLHADLHSSIETSHESDEELCPTMPCTGTSSGQIVPSGLIDLLDGPEPADLSWTSSMATPRIGNSTWSHLNTEERKVLLPSGECFLGGKPRALFPPDADDTVGCHSLNMTLDADTISAVKTSREGTFQTPSDINKGGHPQVKSIEWNSTSENVVSSKEITSDTSCREVLPSNSNKPPGYDVFDLFCSPVHTPKNRSKRRRVRCSLVPSPNREETDFVQQQNGKIDSPVLSGNIPNHMKSIHKFQDDDSLQVATKSSSSSKISFEDPVALRLNPSTRNSSLAESTPNRSCNKLSQSSPILAVDNMHTTDEFLKDISVTALEEMCHAQEQVASISTPLRQTDAETNYQSRKRLVFGNTFAGVSNVPEVETEKNSTECSNLIKEIGTDKNPVQGELDLDDSFMQQLAEMSTTKISNAVCELSVKGRVQAIKNASTSGRNFLYSLQPDQIFHHIHSTQAVKPDVVVSEILNVASIFDSASKISPPKTVLKSTEKFVAFNELKEGLNCEKSKDSHDTNTTKMNNLQQTSYRKSDHTLFMQGKLEKFDESQIFKCHPDPEGRDFNNARKKSLEFSDDTLHKGLDQMKVTIENCDSEIPLSGSPENTDNENSGTCKSRKNSLTDKIANDVSKEDNISTLMKDGASSLSDTQMAQVADDMQLLLQLMDCEEELNPWLEPECSPAAMDKDKIMPLSISVSRKDVPCNSDGKTMNGFSTAGGKAITVSEEHLEKAKLLLRDCEDGEFTSQQSVIDKKRNLMSSVKQESRSVQHAEGSVYHEKVIKDEKDLNGFTTASGNFIKISEERLKQSRLLFVEDSLESSSKENEVLSSSKYTRDFTVHKEDTTENFRENDTEKKQYNSVLNSGTKSLQSIQKKMACDFLIPYGKTATMSHEHQETTKFLVQDLDGDDVHKQSTPKKQESSSISVGPSKHFVSKVQTLQDQEVANTFSTANGKSIKISEESLKQSRLVFQEEDLKMSSTEDDILLSLKHDKEAISKRNTKSGLKTESQNTCCKMNNMTQFKRRKMPQKDVNSVATLHPSCDNRNVKPKGDFGERAPNIKRHIQGFSTSNQNLVPISEAAMNNARGILIEDSVTLLNSGNNVASTPEENCIKISDSEQSNHISVVHDEASSTNVQQDTNVGCTMVSSDPVPNETNERLFNLKSVQPYGKRKKCTSCFFTAGGKEVPVTDQALQKAKIIFEDEVSLPSPFFNELETSNSSNPLNISIENEQLFEAQPNFSPYQGFSTASGKSVHISDASLKKAKHLFEELELTNDTKHKSAPPRLSPAPALAECGVKELDVMKHEACSVEAVEICTTNTGLPQLKGFSTASGKSVIVSEEALSKAKILFKGEAQTRPSKDKEPDHQRCENPIRTDEHHVHQPGSKDNGGMKGFSTASGKAVSISKKALTEAKRLFRDEVQTGPSNDEELHNQRCESPTRTYHERQVREPVSKDNGGLKGFSTASGRSVTVSADALSKAKMFFNDEVQIGRNNYKELDEQSFRKINETSPKPFVVEPHSKDNGGMKGFLTASGNHVEVSLESLAKARSVFDEQDCKENKVNNYNLSEMKPRNSNELSACFNTGNGKRITVSEESLNTARLLLKEGASNEDNCAASLLKVDSKDLCLGGLVPHHGGESKRKTCHRSLTSLQSRSFNQERNNYQDEESNSHMLKHLSVASITQEVSESTAALLADEEFSKEMECSNDAPSSLISVCTSPSMLTDCSNSFQPVITEDHMTEPSTSPILISSDKRGPRRRARKGRLSLGSISTPEKLDILKTSLSAPIKGDSFPSSSKHVETEVQSATLKATRKSLDSIEGKFVANLANTPLQESLNTKLNSVKKLSPVCKASTHSTPTQSPFRIPYRKALTTTKAMPSPKVQSQKRRASCIPSIEHGDIKRLKLAEERPVSLNNIFPVWSSDELTDGNERKLRPEVLELRHRAAEEQQKYVSGGGVAKGPRLRPCTGSLLARKSMAGEERVSWSQLVGSALPGHYTSEQLESMGVRASLFPITAGNSALFRFSAWDFYSVDLCRENVSGVPVGDGALLILDDNGEAGVEEVARAFLASPGVDPSLVPQNWVKNHYRWIVWKLAAMERSFPHYFARRCLTPHMLMQQLKYRYDREIDHSQRPALRRILEHDDAAAKRMVLCVASIIQPKENKMPPGVDLELSDGWYSVVTSIDQDLQHRVARGIVRVGTKLVIHGAELLNCSEGCSPLEVRGDVRLQIFSNSTRRARWYAKLGFQQNPGPFSVALSSVLGSGGVVGSVSTFVARVYPIVYMEKKAEGKTVVRSQRAEAREASISERRRQEMAERVYNDALTEVQQRQRRRGTRQRCSAKLTSNYIARITSGEELCELLEDDPDPIAIQSMLSAEQQVSVEECLRTKQEALHRDIEVRVKKQLNSVKSSERVIIPILKLRLLDSQDVGHRCSAILSIWRPSEDMASMFKEGQRLTVFGATASGFRCGELQLSANRSTRYKSHQSTETPEDIQRHVSTFRSLYEPGWTPKFGELDVVGVVIKIGAPPNTDGNSTCFQVVYMADKDHTLIGVSFWGGLKDYGVDDILCPRTLLAATNLQWRGGPVMQSVPCVYASELSTFSSSPRQPYIQESFTDLRLAVSKEVIAFVDTCNQKLEEALSLKNQPAFPRNPNPTLVGAKQGLGTPGHPVLRSSTLSPQVSTPLLPTPVSSVLNSKNAAVTCSTSQSFPSNNAQHKLLMEHQALLKANSSYSPSVERRLAKLEMYGEPPPISPIVMRQPPKSLRKEFKVPRKINSAAPVVSKQDSPPMSPKAGSQNLKMKN